MQLKNNNFINSQFIEFRIYIQLKIIKIESLWNNIDPFKYF